MRIVLTTVLSASVTIDNEVVGKINRGFCVLVGFTHNDTKEIVDKMIDKMLGQKKKAYESYVFYDGIGAGLCSHYGAKSL